MTALNERSSSGSGILRYLHICLMVVVLFASFPEALHADPDRERFGHLSLTERWQGDFHGMVERRLVRVLVVLDKVGFFIDQGHYQGINADLLKAFEKFINQGDKDKVLKIDVMVLPVHRDQLIPHLLEGKGDIAVGNLTIDNVRFREVEFSTPFLTDVKKIIVTDSKIPHLGSIENLAGQHIHLRKSSSSHQHALELNKVFQTRGLKPMQIVEVDEQIEDTDLLQLVKNGVISVTAVDEHMAKLWGKIYGNIRLHRGIALGDGGEISWAFRKNSPTLAEVLNSFVETTKKGTELGNLVFNKYLHDDHWVRDSLSRDIGRNRAVVELFKKYADRYEFDYLMTKAVAYQESQLNHNTRSPCGAVGIMQLLPETAADKNVGIPNIENIEDNVHAGHKYLRFIQDRYFSDPEITFLNKHLLTFAAYNAGPRKVLDLQAEAKNRGLDPNVWFKNVELVAAEKIGRETVQYVSNIYRYYIAYRLAQKKAHKIKEKYANNVLSLVAPISSDLRIFRDDTSNGYRH